MSLNGNSGYGSKRDLDDPRPSTEPLIVQALDPARTPH